MNYKLLFVALLLQLAASTVLGGGFTETFKRDPLSGEKKWIVSYDSANWDWQTGGLVDLQTPESGCDRFSVDIHINATTWFLEIYHRYACNCEYNGRPRSWGYCIPNYMQWPRTPLRPLVVTITDLTVANKRLILASRHSADQYPAIDKQTHIIPDALQRSSLIHRHYTIEVKVNFYDRQTNRISVSGKNVKPYVQGRYLWCDNDGYYFSPTPLRQIVSPNPEVPYDNYNNGLGIRLRRTVWKTGSNPRQQWYIRRKPPVPPFSIRIFRGDNPPVRYSEYEMLALFTSENVTTSELAIPEWGGQLLWCPYPRSCGCYTYSYTIDFYETVRWYEATFSIPSFASFKASLPDAGDYVDLEPIDATAANPHTPTPTLFFPRLRVQWMNIARHAADIHFWVNSDPEKILSLYVIQNQPISDLWVEVTDNNGKRIFNEMESRVPMVSDLNKRGQVGWHEALDFGRYNSASATIKVRYNRQVPMGKFPPDQKCAMLLRWIEDRGGMIDKVMAPIPPTILALPDLMGAVMNEDVNQDDVIFRIVGANNTGVNSWDSYRWYNSTLAPILEKNQTWDFYVNFSGNAPIPEVPEIDSYEFNQTVNFTKYTIREPREYLLNEKLTLTLFFMFQPVHPDDWSTGLFPFYDSFHPGAPLGMLQLLAGTVLDRLLGWSEMPRWIKYQVGNWTQEYQIISELIPYVTRLYPFSVYKSTRCWVMSTAYEVENVTLHLLPFVNILRKGEPNVRLNYNYFTDDFDDGSVELVAMTNLLKDTELIVDYNVTEWIKHEYFMTFGYVPLNARDAATLPGYDNYLFKNKKSQHEFVDHLEYLHNSTRVEAMEDLLSMVTGKLLDLPLTVDGLGATPEQVAQATRILNSEKTVLEWNRDSLEDQIDWLT